MVRPRHIDPRMFFIPKNPCRTLLELRLDAESGALRDTVIFDVPVSRASDRHFGLNEEPPPGPPFLAIQSQGLVFDTRTRVFYDFPDPSIALVCLKDCVVCPMANWPLGYNTAATRSRENDTSLVCFDRAHKNACIPSSRTSQPIGGTSHARTSLRCPRRPAPC